MKIYRLFLKLAFGGLAYHSAGSMDELTALSRYFAGMGLKTLIMEG